jgi:hypothetical protein
MAIALGWRQHAVSLVLTDTIEHDLLFVVAGTSPAMTVIGLAGPGTPRLVRRVGIVQRHHGFALADEHALSDMLRRPVADDDAWMRRQIQKANWRRRR